MRIAALTQAYNEAVNLPLWIKYYGRNFGDSNLFVIDHGSNDGSTAGLGEVNVIRMPRTPYDEIKKCAALSAQHKALLQFYDVVVLCDCDEFVAPDPDRHADLRSYIEQSKPGVTAAVGMQIHHVLDSELPLDLTRPVLCQRRLAFFTVENCKPVISSVPTQWFPGQHASNVRPLLDPHLYLFHAKFMDYNIAITRHAVNSTNIWSEEHSKTAHGAHHRYGYARFVLEAFLAPMEVVKRGKVAPFEFEAEIAAMTTGLAERHGAQVFGRAEPKFLEIASRFQSVF